MFRSLSFLSLALFLSKESAAVPVPSGLVNSEWDDLYEQAITALMTATGTEPVEFMTDFFLLREDGYGRSTVANTYTYPEVVNSPNVTYVPPLPCSGHSFGSSGEYNVTVCDTVDAIGTYCAANTCPGVLPGVVSGKRSLVDGGQDELVAFALCLDLTNNPPVPANDPDSFIRTGCNFETPAATFDANVRLIKAGLNSRDLFDNPLITNAVDTVDYYVDPDANWVIGDGRLEIDDSIIDGLAISIPKKDHLKTLNVKLYTIDSLVLRYWAKGDTTLRNDPSLNFPEAFNDADYFLRDVMRGYFYKKGASQFFSQTERIAVMDATDFKYNTICAVYYGVLIAGKCNIEPNEMKDFIDSQNLGFSSCDYPNPSDALKIKHYARRMMKTDVFDRTNSGFTGAACAADFTVAPKKHNVP